MYRRKEEREEEAKEKKKKMKTLAFGSCGRSGEDGAVGAADIIVGNFHAEVPLLRTAQHLHHTHIHRLQSHPLRQQGRLYYFYYYYYKTIPIAPTPIRNWSRAGINLPPSPFPS